MKDPSLFEAGCPRIEVAICRKLSSVMSGRNRLLTCDKRAFSAIDSSTTDSLTKEVVEKDVMLLLLLRRDHPGKPDPDKGGLCPDFRFRKKSRLWSSA